MLKSLIQIYTLDLLWSFSQIFLSEGLVKTQASVRELYLILLSFRRQAAGTGQIREICFLVKDALHHYMQV